MAFFLIFVPVWALADDVPVIAALGDSLTAGYGLTSETGLVPQLENWLEAQGTPTKIINGGVSGDTITGGLARFDWTVTPDVKALIVNLGGNDMLRGIDPANGRENMRKILQKAKDRSLPVLLVGQQAAGNFGADYKQAFDAIYPELAAEFGTLFYPFFFSAVMAGDTGLPDWSYFQGDHTHPNAKGVLRIVAAMGPSVQDLLNQISPE